jgi:RNA polymerase sigma-70 factor, ECF subfamily
MTADIRGAAERVFREESGRILAGLIRVSNSFDRAEEALQEAFASALMNWSESGLPANPAAWITAAAQRKLIDRLRREQTHRNRQDSLRCHIQATAVQPELDTDPMHFPDNRLRLIFTCCHPALNQDAQIALTLRTLGGLTTAEIAKAFLIPEATLAQRLVRAKRKIQEAHIPYEVPAPDRLRERLAAVQSVLYLIFNEGYAATSGDGLTRADLCVEAIRLARMLCAMLPDEPESEGLLALMLLQHSRHRARTAQGRLITLDEQDRSLWDDAAIREGVALTEAALARRQPGPFQLQAAIAAVHAEAQRAEDTDWRQIAALYERLYECVPTPVVALNRAVAIGMSSGYAAGLGEIDRLHETLGSYYLLHAARADFLRRLQRWEDAAQAYERALALATNPVEAEFLRTRLAAVRRNP